MGATIVLPDLAEVDTWWEKTVLPKRTASSGFSPNRLWKGPLSIVRGNNEDPDGLCGDAASYAYEQYFKDFGDYRTRDGQHMGLVLWEGSVMNHIANVLLVASKTAAQKYRWNTKTGTAESVDGKGQYGASAFLALPVYDLYYKAKRQTLKTWWSSLDSSMGGTVKVALMHSIDD